MHNQEDYLKDLIARKVFVIIFMTNGYQMKGTIVGTDADTILLRADGTDQMLYKHAVSTVKPTGTGK